jgi:chorismate mutase
MIETHCDPDNALSDAKQQVTPERLGEILAHLISRRATADDGFYQRQLQELRAEIDQLDNRLIEVLGRRMDVVLKIGDIKRRNNVTVLQASRWDQLLKRVERQGAEYDFSPEFIDGIFHAIHQESINRQQKILENGKA